MNDLKGWTVQYIKNRDMSMRKLVDTEDKGDSIICHYKDKSQCYLISESLNDKALKAAESGSVQFIVCSNTEGNLTFLMKNWDKLSKISNFSIIFVSANDKWLINPKVHSLIADPASIKTGLRTMFDTANGKIAEIKAGKKKSSMFEESSESDEDPEAEG